MLKIGNIIEGTVIDVSRNSVRLNVNEDWDGIIWKESISKEPDFRLKDLVAIGDRIRAEVMCVDQNKALIQLMPRAFLTKHCKYEKTNSVCHIAEDLRLLGNEKLVENHGCEERRRYKGADTHELLELILERLEQLSERLDDLEDSLSSDISGLVSDVSSLSSDIYSLSSDVNAIRYNY